MNLSVPDLDLEDIFLRVHTKEEAEIWADRLCVICSYPRSGSHWSRRMLAEVPARRLGGSASFGPILNWVAGFKPLPINSPLYELIDSPLFVATHGMEQYKPEQYRVFLHRNFPDVFKSCQKAETEIEGCWFAGPEEECYERWKNVTHLGCEYSDIVIDYKSMIADPKAVLKTIYALVEYEVTDEELDLAVLAGSRENMRREQNRNQASNWEVING